MTLLNNMLGDQLNLGLDYRFGTPHTGQCSLQRALDQFTGSDYQQSFVCPDGLGLVYDLAGADRCSTWSSCCSEDDVELVRVQIRVTSTSAPHWRKQVCVPRRDPDFPYLLRLLLSCSPFSQTRRTSRSQSNMVGPQRKPTLISGLPPTLDHLIHKVPIGQLERAIAVFSALGFTVKRGGKHADGLTSNALICLPDGVYIEIVAFEEHPIASTGEHQAEFEQRRKGHWWWNKRPGWVDWSLFGGATDGRAVRVNQLAEESGAVVRYSLPQSGGRVTTDGKGLEWRISTPWAVLPPSSVPFWCEDVTPREWRGAFDRKVSQFKLTGARAHSPIA